MTTTACVIQPHIKQGGQGSYLYPPSYQLQETINLALAIPLHVLFSEIRPIHTIRPSTFIGSGAVDELKTIIADTCVSVAIVNIFLSAIQQRNLEKAWQCKVIDRTALILEIFGKRAQTKEGVAQVELAALSYQKGRLVRSWTHLERQRGSLGFVGGPGESQIEIDRRLIQVQIRKLENQLEKVKKTRTLHRTHRAHLPKIALVGYTNAGKSTLFNAITNAGVYAEDILFATLDPTMRAHLLPSNQKIILSDTVGFISDLPHGLVAAFRATLEEVCLADIILHVQDIASPYRAAHCQDVINVLKELGVDTDLRHIIDVYNKSDLLDDEDKKILHEKVKRQKNAVLVSAFTGEGLSVLEAQIQETLYGYADTYQVSFSTVYGDILNWCHEQGAVLSQNISEDGMWCLKLKLSQNQKKNFEEQWPKYRLFKA